MSGEKPTEPPKKKRGRLKGSKSKSKEPTIEEIKPEEPKKEQLKVEAKPEETKEEPKVEAKPEEPKDAPAEKKEETAIEKVGEEKSKEYTPEEIEEIAKKVETPSDQTPAYRPEHILSQEYEGSTNYEQVIRQVREETEAKLARLRDDPNADILALKKAEEDLMILDSLHENYNIGMNVFRTAKGGRNKLRE